MDKISTRKLVINYFLYLKPKIWFLYISFVLMGLTALFSSCYAYLLGPFLKFLFYSSSDNNTLTIPSVGSITFSSSYSALITLSLSIITVAFLKGLSDFGYQYLIGKLSQYLQHNLRSQLFEHVIKTNYKDIVLHPRGDIISRLTMDIFMFSDTFVYGFAALGRDVLQVVFLTLLAFYMDPKLFLIGLITFPVAGFLIVRLGRKVKITHKEIQKNYGMLSSKIEEILSGILTIKSLLWENKLSEQFSKLSKILSDNIQKAISIRAISSPINEIMAALALGLTIFYAYSRIQAHTLQPENFISFFGALFLLYQPLKNLGNINIQFQSGAAAGQRIEQLMKFIKEKEDGKNITEDKIDITIKNCSFSYNKEQSLLKNINLKIQYGEKIAIVGESGCGKSTLMLLVLKYLDADSGEITINDEDINNLNKASIRREIMLVPQTPYLFPMSIKENILSGLEFDKEKWDKVINIAQLKDIIEKLDDKENSNIGQDGDKFSGGEKQKTCLARALYRSSKVFIFDESLSAIDSLGEAEIIKNLKEFNKDNTIIIISHRFSTIKQAERIIVIKEGQIAEDGSLDYLLEKKGEFYSIMKSQII